MLAKARTCLKAKNEAAGLSTPDLPPGLDFIPASVRSRSRRRVLHAGATLFRSRARPEWLFFVIAGELQLVRHSEQGRKIVLQRVRNGFFAEASVESQAYNCDGVAGGATEVLALPLAAFRQALAADASFESAWTRHLSAEIRRLRAHCERLAMRSTEARVVHYIESEGRGGRIALGRPLKQWALELGVTHEALYRALGRMRRDGTIEVEGTRLRLLGPRKGLVDGPT